MRTTGTEFGKRRLQQKTQKYPVYLNFIHTCPEPKNENEVLTPSLPIEKDSALDLIQEEDLE